MKQPAEIEELVRRCLEQARRLGPQVPLQRLLEALGDAPQRWLECARALLAAGAPPLAGAVLETGLRRWPAELEMLYWLGNARRESGDPRTAAQLLRRVLELQPDHEGAALSLAFLLRETGQYSAAAQTAVGLWRRQGGSLDATLRCARFAKECRRETLAYEVCEEGLRAGLEDPVLQVLAGSLATSLGRFGEARQHLERAVALCPEDYGNLYLLSQVQRYTEPGHPDLARLRQAWNDGRASTIQRGIAGFGYGKALDDLGDYRDAAQVFRRSNELLQPEAPWDAQAWDRQIDALLRTVPGPRLESFNPAVTPVFVVGLPRSGTTLVAERLGRSPQVRNRDELDWIRYLHDSLAAKGALTDAAALQRAAAMYLALLREDDAPARWYIDKNPLNFRYLALIDALFPNARIIYCRRSLRDTALSIWTQHFAHSDMYFSHRFEHIAGVARGCQRLLEGWAPRLRVPLATVDYESLVADPETGLAQLRSFLGITPGDTTGAAGGTAAVATASVWQVRQPVYQRSVERWRHYAAELPELLGFPAAAS